MQFGERLKKARLDKGMTQDQLGQALGGLTGPTISAIEKGTAKTFRDPELILEAAKLLGVSPIWLQFGIGDAELVSETIPLIEWEDISKPPSKRKVIRRIGTTVAVSPKSFALKVVGNSMVAPTGNEVSFREGMIVAIDPEANLTPNAFVLVLNNNDYMLRKFVKEGSKKFLQPLNQLFHQEAVSSQTKILGIVKALLQESF